MSLSSSPVSLSNDTSTLRSRDDLRASTVEAIVAVIDIPALFGDGSSPVNASEVERGLKDLMNVSCRAAMGEYIEGLDDGRPTLLRDGEIWTRVPKTRNTIMTLFGPVTYVRHRYRRADSPSLVPVDEQLGLAMDYFTEPAGELAVLLIQPASGAHVQRPVPPYRRYGADGAKDNWTLIREAATAGAGLLVRANRARSCRVISADGSFEDLWDHVAGQPPLDSKTIAIDACGGPRRREERKVIAFYERRWSIETWFSVLKTGTRVGKRQLDDADDLRKCIVFDAITACHIHDLNFMARTAPQTPADEVVEQDMIDCLYEYLHILGVLRARAPPGHRPDIRTFVVDLAKVAGFDPTKRQPLPGTRKLWEAWMHFRAALILYRGLKQNRQLK